MANPDYIAEQLTAWGSLQTDYAALQMQYDAARKAAIPPEVQALLDAIDATYQAQLDGLRLEMTQLEAAIKAEVLMHGSSVKTKGYQAVYRQGQPIWDDPFLQGYACIHEEILQARRDGKASVILRKATA